MSRYVWTCPRHVSISSQTCLLEDISPLFPETYLFRHVLENPKFPQDMSFLQKDMPFHLKDMSFHLKDMSFHPKDISSSSVTFFHVGFQTVLTTFAMQKELLKHNTNINNSLAETYLFFLVETAQTLARKQPVIGEFRRLFLLQVFGAGPSV